MLASAEYNHLEVWVESDGDRLREYGCTFLPAIQFHPNTYEAYLELHYNPEHQKTYTIHVRNTSPKAWKGHLLSNPDIDGALLCTEFIVPPDTNSNSHNSYGASCVEEEFQKCGNEVRHEVFAVDPLAIKEPLGAREGEDLHESAIYDTLVDSFEDAAMGQGVNFLDNLDCTLGKINLMIFRGTVVYPIVTSTSLKSAHEPIGEAYNGTLPLQQTEQSGPIFHTIDEDEVDPWIKFVLHYGTREALIANGIITSSSVPPIEHMQTLQLETSDSSILVPASPEPESYFLLTDTPNPSTSTNVNSAVTTSSQALQIEHDRRPEIPRTKAKVKSKSRSKFKIESKAKVEDSTKKTMKSSYVKPKTINASSATATRSESGDKQVPFATDTEMTQSTRIPLPPSTSLASSKMGTDAVLPQVIARDFWQEEFTRVKERKKAMDQREGVSSDDKMRTSSTGQTRENPIDLSLDD